MSDAQQANQPQQPAQQSAQQPAQQPAQQSAQPTSQQPSRNIDLGQHIQWSPSLWKFISIAIIFIAFILCCVGTTHEQVCWDYRGYYGYRGGHACTWLTSYGGYGYDSYGCFSSRIRASYAFAILACLTISALLVVSVAVLCVKVIPQIVVLGLAVVTFVWLLISWPLSASIIHSGCDGYSLDHGSPGAGLGCLITAWIFVLIDVVLEAAVFMKLLPPMLENLKF